ncbi:hypothetical protein [Crossiella cryophila]|uniref:Uncharacterized protein n=1 Tax=Crossiella cryophila TaxID=43355 RepID=A0A7W7CE25_9PSEU|nr:hypothetical protein [Crossiella cryophila]MBB4679451.1 hypothetical protein [Crossiella cryophila]
MSAQHSRIRLVNGPAANLAAQAAVRAAALPQRALFTCPALDHAAALFAAGRRRVCASDRPVAVEVASACLTATHTRYRVSRLPTQHAAIELLNILTHALHTRGLAARRTGLLVALPWSVSLLASRRRSEALQQPSVSLESAWQLVLTRAAAQPAITVIASYDTAGAHAVAELVHELLTGMYGDPFARGIPELTIRGWW